MTKPRRFNSVLPLRRKLVAMGATHVPTSHGQIAIDRENKIVTTPCYMLNSRVDQVAEGADNLIRAMLEMMA